jgi:2-oxoglutarate dehydrogenase E1 component
MHLRERERVAWIQTELERKTHPDGFLTTDERERILRLIIRAESFEKFLGKRFSGGIRFSIEGGEALIPGLTMMFERASELGVKSIQLGMAHRGRLNVVANCMEQPLESIMSQFEPYLPDDQDLPNNSDDVRYHLGTSRRLSMPGGRTLEVSLAANPSHLEAVNSVVLGLTRAKQNSRRLQREEEEECSGDTFSAEEAAAADSATAADRQGEIVPLLLHGDASMFQGSLREALGFGTLTDYSTGGTIHIIVNNLIGYTTLPKQADSALYCSDVARITNCPVFHVNADDPEMVVAAFRMAIGYRQKFRSDVFIDLCCF